MDVGAWLRSLGLERYEALFRINEIDDEVLPELTEADLEKLGLPLGPRKRLLKAIAALSADADPVPRAAAAISLPAIAPAAESRQLTVVYRSVANSTAPSAGADAEELREIIRACHSYGTPNRMSIGGYVVKYLGDGVLAGFGYQRAAREGDVGRSVGAGPTLIEADHWLRPPDDSFLESRAAAGTGPVVIHGPAGEEPIREPTSIGGETPTLALTPPGESGESHGDESARRSGARPFGPDSAAVTTDGDRQWVETWRALEIRDLSNRVDDLERQLWRRTVILGSALALSGVAAMTVVALLVLPLYGFDSLGAALKAASIFEAPASGEPKRAQGVAHPVAQQGPAAVRSRDSGELGRAGRRIIGQESTTGPVRQQDPTSREASAEVVALHTALVSARERIAELEAAGIQYEATIARLQAESESRGAEVQDLGERLQKLSAVLATAAGGHSLAEEGHQAGPGETEAAEPRAARVGTAAVGDSAAETGGGGTQASEAVYYTATGSVNVRAEPSNASRVLAVLKRGDVVRGIGGNGGWLRVAYGDGLAEDTSGWVYNRFLNRVGAAPEESGQ